MYNWFSLFMVAIGGAVGSVSRFTLSHFLSQQFNPWIFPTATFLINVVGCLFIGVLAGVGERYQWLTTDLRLLLMTGVLGGFTTFSAFGLETFALIRREELMVALAYSLFSIIFGLIFVWLGHALVTGLTR